MVAETDSVRVEDGVAPAVLGEMTPLVSPERDERKEESPHGESDAIRPNNEHNIQEIVGIEETSIPHLGWFIAGVAVMLILINVFSIILH